MASFALAASHDATAACTQLRALKNHLHTRFPSAKSAHLTEAIACGLGFQTHAALLTALDSSSFPSDVRQAFHPHAMLRRLHALAPAALAQCTRPLPTQWQTPPAELRSDQTALQHFGQLPLEVQKRSHDWARRLHRSCGQWVADALELGHYGRPEPGSHDTLWWTGVDPRHGLPGWGRSVGEGFFRFSENEGHSFGHDQHCFRPLPLTNGRHVLYTSAVLCVFDATTTEQQLQDCALRAASLGWTCTRLEGWNWFSFMPDGVLLCFRPRTEHAEYLRLWQGSFKQWLWSHRPRLLRGAGASRRKVLIALSHCAHLPLDCSNWEDFQQRFLSDYLAGAGHKLPASTPEICQRLWIQWHTECPSIAARATLASAG